MTDMLIDAQCIPVEYGFRILVSPPEPFLKVGLEFLDGGDADLDLLLEGPVPGPGRCNWTTRDPDGRPQEKLRRGDDLGIRKVEVYATLDPMTECSFIVRDSGRGNGTTYLSYVSVSVTGLDGVTHRLGFLRLQ